MIAYVRGIVSHIFSDCCFIDVQGIGYRLYITEPTRQKLKIGIVSSLFTYMHVREDAMLLYGFISQDEYDTFLHLVSINGVGPRVALNVLSAAEPRQLCIAITQKNIAFLTKIPGIGKKTAERMILELKDKMSKELTGLPVDETTDVSQNSTGGTLYEVTQALLALGYSQTEILPVIKEVGKESAAIEDIIKAALRELSRR